jgi:hypothetical protein
MTMGTDDDGAVLLAEFRAWLDRERGMSPVSVRCYSKQAKAFLAAIGGPGAVSGLDAGQITAFMVEHSRDRNSWSAQAMVTSPRAFQPGQARVADCGEQQQQPGVIARQRCRFGRPAGQGGSLDQIQLRGRAAAALVTAGQPRQPSAWRICQAVCAESGIPSPVHAAAISATECPAARSSRTRARSWPVALRGPLGPGLVSANRASLPLRSSVAIWWMLAVE